MKICFRRWCPFVLLVVLLSLLSPLPAGAGRVSAFFELAFTVAEGVQNYEELREMFEQIYLTPASNDGVGGSGQGDFEIWQDDAGFYVVKSCERRRRADGGGL